MAWCFAFKQGGDGFHHLFQGQLLGHFSARILRDSGGYAFPTLPLGLYNVWGVRSKCVQVGVKLGDIMERSGYLCIVIPSTSNSFRKVLFLLTRWKSKNNLEQMLPYLNHLGAKWWLKHSTKVWNNSTNLPCDFERIEHTCLFVGSDCSYTSASWIFLEWTLICIPLRQLHSLISEALHVIILWMVASI